MGGLPLPDTAQRTQEPSRANCSTPTDRRHHRTRSRARLRRSRVQGRTHRPRTEIPVDLPVAGQSHQRPRHHPQMVGVQARLRCRTRHRRRLVGARHRQLGRLGQPRPRPPRNPHRQHRRRRSPPLPPHARRPRDTQQPVRQDRTRRRHPRRWRTGTRTTHRAPHHRSPLHAGPAVRNQAGRLPTRDFGTRPKCRNRESGAGGAPALEPADADPRRPNVRHPTRRRVAGRHRLARPPHPRRLDRDGSRDRRGNALVPAREEPARRPIRHYRLQGRRAQGVHEQPHQLGTDGRRVVLQAGIPR